MKYILVTGGVISGIGKGVVASSLGVILKHCGIAVTSIKIDPYINIGKLLIDSGGWKVVNFKKNSVVVAKVYPFMYLVWQSVGCDSRQSVVFFDGTYGIFQDISKYRFRFLLVGLFYCICIRDIPY